jgi:hypothetical protein
MAATVALPERVVKIAGDGDGAPSSTLGTGPDAAEFIGRGVRARPRPAPASGLLEASCAEWAIRMAHTH